MQICNDIVNDVWSIRSVYNIFWYLYPSQIIAAKSAIYNTAKLENSPTDSFFGKEKSMFIDRVLNLVFKEKEFSIEDARDQINTILMAVISSMQIEYSMNFF